MARELPSLSELAAFYSCDPAEGVIRLKVARSSSPAGKEYRSLDKNGYVVVHPTVNGVRHHLFAHRLAWALYYGEHPPRDMMIDHVNRNRADNRKANLRLVDSFGNALNSAHTKKPISVPRNVSVINQNGKARYQVSRSANNKVYYLGVYDDLDLAARIAERGYR